jgi:hypothetical chaperone protein
MKTQCCGLDFGTSNSTIGVWTHGAPRLAEVEDGKEAIPSAIFFNSEDNDITFGRSAIFDYVDGAEGRLMRALKSVLGTSLAHETTQIGQKSLPFKEILGFFIAHMKQKAEDQLGCDIDNVVLGRPIHFVDGNPGADQEAQDTLEKIARAQGFRHISFQYEPVAAALDYEQSVSREETALIIDIGGGTSDFTVVRVSPERRRKADRIDDVLSRTGVHIGGTDVDRLLSLYAVMPHLGYRTTMLDEFGKQELEVPSSFFHTLATWQKINFLYNRKTINAVRTVHRTAFEKDLLDRLIHVLEARKGHSLAIEVENAKIALTEADQAAIDLTFVDHGLKPILTRDELHACIAEQVDSLRRTAAQALSDAGIAAAAVDTVFLTGGSTAIPLVRTELLKLVPDAQVVEGNRFGSIGIGLAIDAHRRYGMTTEV